jgi:hypothetical protein
MRLASIAMAEKNPLVASGEFERVYVTELSPGDELATGETVVGVNRVSDWRVLITLNDGTHAGYKATSTLLVKV